MTTALPVWTIVTPAAALAIVIGAAFGLHGGYYVVLIAAGLAACVFAAVHHADVIALRVGEPYGTLVLAVAVTLIEVALIVSLMIAGGDSASALARDTVFATVMIILTGILGLCLSIGGINHWQQEFSLDGVSAALAALASITIITLVFPNFTTTTPGPFYSPSQLVLVAIVSVVVYGSFVLAQTVGHRQLFLDGVTEKLEAAAPSNKLAAASGGLLLVSLAAVVLLAKKIAPELEHAVVKLGAPHAVVGVVIAAIVLLPEGLAAVRATLQNRLQTSLNLALGSALASIGLTIPAVSVLSLAMHTKLKLGIDSKSMVLLMLALFIVTLVLRTGRTIILHGIVLLLLFAVFIFTTVVP